MFSLCRLSRMKTLTMKSMFSRLCNFAWCAKPNKKVATNEILWRDFFLLVLHLLDFLAVTPLGCWKVTPDIDTVAQTDQSPGKCAYYCRSQGLPYSAIDQTITDEGNLKGTCYCTSNYSIGGRSNRCNTVCQDQNTAGTIYFGYLCGFSGGQGHASVYAPRESGKPSSTYWSFFSMRFFDQLIWTKQLIWNVICVWKCLLRCVRDS